MPHTYGAKLRGWLQFSQFLPRFVARLRYVCSRWCHVHSDFRGIHKGIYYRNYSMRSFWTGSSASHRTSIYQIYNFLRRHFSRQPNNFFPTSPSHAILCTRLYEHFRISIFELTFESDAHTARKKWRRKESAPHVVASSHRVSLLLLFLLLVLSNKCGLTSIHFRWRCVACFPFLGWDMWVWFTFF